MNKMVVCRSMDLLLLFAEVASVESVREEERSQRKRPQHVLRLSGGSRITNARSSEANLKLMTQIWQTSKGAHGSLASLWGTAAPPSSYSVHTTGGQLRIDPLVHPGAQSSPPPPNLPSLHGRTRRAG